MRMSLRSQYTGEQLVTFSNVWSKADAAQKHNILHEMFEAIYVDTDLKLLVSVKPYAKFVPVFRQTNLVFRAGKQQSRPGY